MSRFKFVLSSLWFYAVMIVGLFLSCDLGFLTENPLGTMPLNSYFLLTALFCLVLIAYFFAEHKKNKMSIDWVLAPILIALLVCNLIAIWHNSDFVVLENPENGNVAEIAIDSIRKVKDTIFTVVTYAFVYVVGFVFSRSKVKSKKLVWLAFVVLAINIIFCIISLFSDRAFFASLLGQSESAYKDGCRSVYQNENAFGESLLVGLICAIIIVYQKPRWAWIWILLIIDFVFIFFTTSATCIFVGTICLVTFSLIEIIYGYVRKHIITSTILAVSLALLVFAFILVLSIGSHNDVSAIVAINNFIRREILRKDFGSFSSRKDIWKHVIELSYSSPFTLWFGFGMNISNDILSAYEATYSPMEFSGFSHNGFLKILLDGGLITFIPYVLSIVYFLYCLVRLTIKKHFHFSLVYFTLALTILLHDMFESSHFFKNYALSMINTLLVFMPPIIGWKNLRNPKLKNNIMCCYSMPTQGVSSKHFISMVSFVIIGLIVAALSIFTGPYIYHHNFIMKAVLLGIAFLFVSLIFVPYLTFIWYKKTSDYRFIARILLNIILIFGTLALSMYLLYTHVTKSLKILGVIGLGIYAACLFIDLLIYSLIRKCSLSVWIKETIKSIFVYNLGGKIIGMVLAFMTMMLVQIFMDLELMSVVVMMVMSFFIYMITYLLFPSRSKNEMLEDFNEEGILSLKRLIMEEKI